MTIRFSVHSDLHTEFFGENFCYQEHTFLNFNQDKPLDYLFLAGDIGNKKSLPVFFEQLRQQIPTDSHTKIIFVLGNHEYYGAEYHLAIAAYRELAQQYNITLLENELLVDNENQLLIYGGTLWSDFALGGNVEKSLIWAQLNISDFHYIKFIEKYNKFRKFRASDAQKIFKQSTSNIKKWFAKSEYQNYKKIAVTHFLPLKDCIDPKHKNYESGAYWASNIPEIVKLADVWVYGHSHDNISQSVNIDGKDVLLVSNQLGYMEETKISFPELYTKTLFDNGYKRDCLIELD